MNTKILTIFTRTPLHVGAGSSVGAVDQPIIRERHTRFPSIPGSSLKGVVSSLWPEQVQATGQDKDGNDKPRVKDGKPVMIRAKEPATLFGSDDDKNQCSGILAFGEAKLLAFPVRSAKGCFAFVTSPICLERFARDKGIDLKVPSVADSMTCLAGADVNFEDRKAVVLEEYKFAVKGEFPKEWFAKLLELLPDDPILKGSENRFVLLSDADMSYFAVNACQVSQHVSIDSTTGTAAHGKLFNQEEVPSETLFYAPVTYLRERDDEKDLRAQFESRLSKESLIQFGGKGSTGIGYCSVKLG